MIVIDGVISGTWKQVLKKKMLEIKTDFFVPLSTVEKKKVKAAIERYLYFTGKA